MKHIHIYSTLILLLLSSMSYSQSWAHRKYEFYYGIGPLNFMGDIGQVPSKRIWVVIPETISLTANAGFKYNFAGRQYLTGSMFLGQMFAKDHEKGGYAPGRKNEFNSFFTEFSLRYEYMIGNEKPRKNVYRKLGETKLKNFNLPLYIFSGAGVALNIGSLTQPTNDGKFVMTENYVNLAPVVFIGFGFRKKLSNVNYVSIEANYRVALNDGLDGADTSKGYTNSNGDFISPYGAWVDEYQTITINYTHKLGSKRNGMPQFRNR